MAIDKLEKTEGKVRYAKPVNDKLSEVIDAINGLTEGTGDASVNNLDVAGDLTVAGDSEFTGEVTYTNDVTFQGEVAYDEDLFLQSYLFESVATPITAFATGGQASATNLPSIFNNVATVATAGDSVKLPDVSTAGSGCYVYVRNAGAFPCDVFPFTGASIDGGSANAAVRVQPGQVVRFSAISSTAWVTDNRPSGTVSQATNVTTGVTLNAVKGVITTQAASAAADAAHTFTVTNSFCRTTSHVAAYIMDYSGTIATNGNPAVIVDNRTNGTFDIIIVNTHGANALSGTLVIGFEIKN